MSTSNNKSNASTLTLSGEALSNALVYKAQAPLDARLRVATIAQRDTLSSSYYAYPGMIVYVEATNQHYTYVKNGDGSYEWQDFTGSSGGANQTAANQIIAIDKVTCGNNSAIVNLKSNDYINLSWEPDNSDEGYANLLIEGNSNPEFVSLKTELDAEIGNDLSVTKTVTADSFNARSDVRLKENFVEYAPKKSILDLPIYTFDFINGVKNQLGCKAQDLQEICPEIVVENNDGYLSIQESKIVYLLLQEVKTLREELLQLRQGGELDG